jgi:hypothetical protein
LRFGPIGALRRASERGVREEVRVLRPSRLETIGWQADEKEN